jgi:tripartite-type tricarboxylate transporter receptor subunit TctC
MFSDPVAALPQVRAGKLRALGATSASRIPAAPEIPPLAEVGVPSFDTAGWGMIVAPANTPAAIVARLHAALDDILTESDVQEQISNLGMIPAPNRSPTELQAFIDSEMVRWGKVVQQAGLAGSE